MTALRNSHSTGSKKYATVQHVDSTGHRLKELAPVIKEDHWQRRKTLEAMCIREYENFNPRDAASEIAEAWTWIDKPIELQDK